MPPYAYIRRSRVDTRRPGTLSYDQQLAEIRKTAERHGDEIPPERVIEDWGRSGRLERHHLRAGFEELEALVASRQATAIYAYDLSRLGRSIITVLRLAQNCAANNIPIRCASGFSPDVSTAEGRLVLSILSALAQFYAENVQERMAGITQMRRERGDWMGPPPFGYKVVGGQLVEDDNEDPSAVLHAFQDAGSYAGAARLLNEAGIPPRGAKGATFWRATTIKGILQRLDPTAVPRGMTQGRRPDSPFRLKGLLVCPYDQKTLVGHRVARRAGWAEYQCRTREDPNHPYPRSVAESKLLPWIKAELSLLRDPAEPDIDADQPDPDTQRDLLAERRERVIAAYLDGTIQKDRRDVELQAISEELDGLADLQTVRLHIVNPGPDEPGWRPVLTADATGMYTTLTWQWGSDPETANALIRSVLRSIELDGDLLPVSATWLNPSLRGTGRTRIATPREG